MKAFLKSAIRTTARKSGHIILDLRKDQPTFHFLPGHLRKIFRLNQVNCVIDVGANVGQFASMVRSIGFNGRILSIEPCAESYAVLQAKAADVANWKTMNIALGEADEERSLNIFGANDLNSFLKPTSNMNENILNSQIIRTQPVTVRRLDNIFKEITEGISQPRVFLKLDTQGFDLQAVKGAANSLSSIVGIQSELSLIPLYEGIPDYLEALSFYRDLGFQPTGVFPVEFERQTGHILELDVILTRRVAQVVDPTSTD